MRQLVVGCSFLCDFYSDNEQIKVIHMPGAGNQLIAATVLHEISKETYQSVYVTWSGINRIDIPVGLDLHRTLNTDYEYIRQLGHTVWYSSGGIGASGASAQCPSEIKKIFHSIYVGASQDYLTDLTLSSMLLVQGVLEQHRLPYRMSFIYDAKNFSFDQDLGWLVPVLGRLGTRSSLYNLIDWQKIQTQNTPFEWCKAQGMLKPDGFHPTKTGMAQWILENFNLDITKLVDQTQ